MGHFPDVSLYYWDVHTTAKQLRWQSKPAEKRKKKKEKKKIANCGNEPAEPNIEQPYSALHCRLHNKVAKSCCICCEVTSQIGMSQLPWPSMSSSKVCNLLWREIFLIVPNNDPGTHFVGYLRCHDACQMWNRSGLKRDNLMTSW